MKTLEIVLKINENNQQLPQVVIDCNSTVLTVNNNVVSEKRNLQDVSSHEQLQSISFLEYIRLTAERKRQAGQLRTAETYRAAYLSMQRFMGGRDLPLSDVSSTLMERYEAYLQQRQVCPNTTSFYMRRLRATYNLAVAERLVTNNSPFRNVYTGIAKTNKRAITISDMSHIRQLKLTDHSLEYARNLFLFSFYTRGMSFIDMAYLLKNDVNGGLLTYRRKKTGQLITINWDQRLQQLSDRIGTGTGKYLLPIIQRENGKERNQMRYVQWQVNQNLKTIARLASLNGNLSMYVARHTWASVALQLEVPLSVISQGMGHDSERTTRIYLKTLDHTPLDRACDAVNSAIE